MKVAQVNYNTSFQSRYLPNELCRNINILKSRMENETVILKGNGINQVINTRGISINNGEAVFKDGKYLAKRNKDNELVPYGSDTAMIEFDNIRIISNGNGEIIEHKKPFYKNWDSIIEKFNNYIKYAIENYSNENIITKISSKKEIFTPEGKKQAEKVMEIFNSINPFSNK